MLHLVHEQSHIVILKVSYMRFSFWCKFLVAACVVLNTWWNGNAIGQAITPVSPADPTVLATANADDALFQWTTTGQVYRVWVEFSWDRRFRCPCRDCYYRHVMAPVPNETRLGPRAWANVVRLARLNDNVVYWRLAASTEARRARRRGRRRWVFEGWEYSTAFELGIPEPAVAIGVVENTATELKLNFTASGLDLVRVWISNDAEFPLSRRRRGRGPTFLFAPQGSSYTIVGSTLGRLHALAETGSLFWRVTGQEIGTGEQVESATGDLWDRNALANAGADTHNAGFGRAVALDGTGSRPSAGGNPLTYTWTQTAGPTVALANANTATPNFTAPSAQEVLDSPDQARFGVVDVDPQQNCLTFLLTVADQNGRSDTDTVNVFMSAATGGQPNVPVKQLVHLNAPDQSGTGGYNWSLTTVPTGSVAALWGGTTRNPSFTPDVAGTYVVTETVADPDETIVINAGTWLGVENSCSFCHSGRLVGVADQHTPWMATGHASMFRRGITGALGLQYNSSCIGCHTVGHNEEAANDGFDDVAVVEGWEFPASLGNAAYSAMPGDLRNLANIQCENCHGPGSQHGGRVDAAQVSISFNMGVCAVCHNSQKGGLDYRKPTRWRNSGHAHAPRSSSSSCAGCHTGQGFAQRMDGETVTSPDSPEPQTCAACHDPHDATNIHQLRTLGSVALANGKTVSGGRSSVCIECHHARRDTREAATLFAEKRAPHHSSQTDVFVGNTAFQFGRGSYTNTIHTAIVSGQCIYCHMAEGSNGMDTVGGHTFNISSAGVNNMSPCNSSGCHISNPLQNFNRPARGDYDGDGRAEGIQDEVDGLIQVLTGAINASLGGGAFAVSRGRINFTDRNGNAVTPSEVQYQAAFNCLFIDYDGSRGIHNVVFAVQVLQRSYLMTTGRNVPGAVIRY